MVMSDSIGRRQFFSAVILLIGIAMMGYGGHDYLQQSEAMQKAVETEATITNLGTEEVHIRRGIVYEPTATFEYRHQDESFNSSNVFPAGSTSDYNSRSKAESVLEDYQVGETATAYVVPSSPSEAFLKDTQSSVPFESVGLGVLIALVGGFHLARHTFMAS